MVETLPEYIISNLAHQKTLVKNLLANFKKVNILINNRIVQNNLNTVTEFNRCLLKVGPDAIDCVKEYKTQPGNGCVQRQKCATVAGSMPTIRNIITGVTVNDVYTQSSTIRNT